MNNTAAELRFIHVSDTHAHMLPSPTRIELGSSASNGLLQVGGYALLTSVVDDCRKSCAEDRKPFLVFHCGDSFQGTHFFTRDSGQTNTAVLNAINPSFFAFGNHEFDHGPRSAGYLARNAHFPILASNVDFSEITDRDEQRDFCHSNVCSWKNEAGHKAYLSVALKDYRIAIFGLLPANLHDLAIPPAKSRVLDPATVAKEVVNRANLDGCHSVIALSHLGYSEDIVLAERVPELGAIFGGHSHELQGELTQYGLDCVGPYGQSFNGVPIFHSGANAQCFGSGSLCLSQDGELTAQDAKTQILVDQSAITEGDAKHLRKSPHIVLSRKSNRILRILGDRTSKSSQTARVFALTRPLEHQRLPTATGRSQVAQELANALHARSMNVTPTVDVSIVNAGVVRKSISAGVRIDIEQFSEIVPFDLKLAVLELEGHDLMRLLARAVKTACSSTMTGAFPYVSGLTFDFDDLGYAKDFRIWSPGKKDVPLGVSKKYRIATTEYLATGKDGYLEFGRSKNVRFLESTVRETFFEHLCDNSTELEKHSLVEKKCRLQS